MSLKTSASLPNLLALYTPPASPTPSSTSQRDEGAEFTRSESPNEAVEVAASVLRQRKGKYREQEPDAAWDQEYPSGHDTSGDGGLYEDVLQHDLANGRASGSSSRGVVFDYPVNNNPDDSMLTETGFPDDRDLSFLTPPEAFNLEEEETDGDPLSLASYRRHSSPNSESPASPRSPSPTPSQDKLKYARSPSPMEGGRMMWDAGTKGLQALPFSLWGYLQEEVLAVEMDGEEGIKSERVTNFLTVPGEVEKIIAFGFVICLDSFLYSFTILPLRFMTALSHLVSNSWFNAFQSTNPSQRRHLRLSHKCDLVKALITMGTLVILHRITDASQMYHSVRGQETLKLYVIFNVLEIADRLCCSFGQDLQDSLFSRQTLGRRIDGSHPRIRPVALVGLNLAYVVAHSLVLFYQLVTLNVAINSYSNALLTLLLSNQFVEIKGAVFKKFEKEQLFQVTCADIVERFQLAIMLFIIALRNLIELSSASSSSLFSFLPASFSLTLALPSLPTLSLLQTIFSPAVIVLLSECAVDWLKHAFITKFNHIRPAVYGRFIDVLCKDLVGGASKRKDQPFVDQSPLVARRLGFAALPLGCLVVRVIFQAFEMLTDNSHVDECAPGGDFSATFTRGLFLGSTDLGGRISAVLLISLGICVVWASLIALKLLIGINLRAFASSRFATMESRLKEDHLNDRSRPHIGITSQEKELDRQASQLLKDQNFDVPGKARGDKISLETLNRYDMVKGRLW